MGIEFVRCEPFQRLRVTPAHYHPERGSASFEFETPADLLAELERQVCSAICDSLLPTMFIDEDSFIAAMKERVMNALLFAPLPQRLRVSSIQLEKIERKNELVWQMTVIAPHDREIHEKVLGFLHCQSALR